MSSSKKPSLRYEPPILFSIRPYEGRICDALDGAPDTGLQSLAMDLYTSDIILLRTRNVVKRTPGHRGAGILMDNVEILLKRNPEKLGRVLDIMADRDCLRDISQEIRASLKPLAPLTVRHAELDVDMQSSQSDVVFPDPVHYEAEDEVLEDAKALEIQFQSLIDTVIDSVDGIDVARVKLRLSILFTNQSRNIQQVERNAVLEEIDAKPSPISIIEFLIHHKLVGYLNHQLLSEVFMIHTDYPELATLMEDYNEAHSKLFKSTDLKSLCRVFRRDSSIAPKLFPWMPYFIVYLDSLWDNSDFYRWDRLLECQFHWQPFIAVKAITGEESGEESGVISIEYGVLPFFAPAVVRDLANPEVLSLLEEQGVSKIELSEQLKEIAKEENIDELLLEAAEHCHDTETIESLLKKGANVHFKSAKYNHYFPLHLSAMNGNCAAVKLLIEYGADIDDEDVHGQSPLHLAAKKGKIEVVELLLKAGADILKVDKRKSTTLHHAAEGTVETMKLLLNSGAITEVNRKGPLHKTPLHCAAENGHDQIVTLLVESGANIDEKDLGGITPLHLAASHGMKTTVELLLSYNADYTILSKYGDTILHSAAEGGNVEVVKLFFKLCGTPYLHIQSSSTYRCTPVHCAVNSGSKETVEFLLKSGADQRLGSESGYSPLHLAAERGYERIAELLLMAGAGTRTIDESNDDRTPLHCAAQGGHVAVIELLLKYGVDINEKDRFGCTPLHLAVGASKRNTGSQLDMNDSREDAVWFLLTKGANVNEENNYGRTPIYYAAKHDRDLVQLLLQFGATTEQPKNLEVATGSSIRLRTPSVSSIESYSFSRISSPETRKHSPATRQSSSVSVEQEQPKRRKCSIM